MDDPRLRIRIRASRRLLSFLLLSHAMALGSVALTVTGAGTRTVLVTLLLGSLAAELWRHIVPFCRGELLIVYEGGRWSLHEAGKRAPCGLRADSSLFSGLVVLRLRTESRRRTRTFVLMPDSCAAGDLRALRVLLRMRGSQAG